MEIYVRSFPFSLYIYLYICISSFTQKPLFPSSLLFPSQAGKDPFISLFHHFPFSFPRPSLSLSPPLPLFSNYMAAFSTFQQHPFLLDSFFHPNTTPVFSQFYPYEPQSNNEVSEETHMNCTDQSSSVADYMPENGTDQVVTMDKKRKNKDGVSNTSSVQLKDGKEVRGKRQRKRSGLVEDNEGNKAKSAKKDKKKILKEDPTGFIHVRARRGQATDSHSLAERVRREKISERMKVLQTLVPGCDKVTGKAVMLDEIINYVQSLQHQVEFLSMKLASLNPTLYDFGMDLDTFMINPERLNKLVSPTLLSSLEKYNFALPAAYSEATTPSIYPQFFPQGQRTTNNISPDQEDGLLSLDVDDRRQRIANQFSSYQLHQVVGFPLI